MDVGKQRTLIQSNRRQRAVRVNTTGQETVALKRADFQRQSEWEKKTELYYSNN
jgi:hypothetical protein